MISETKNQQWAPSQYPKRRLSVRSRKVSKPRDLYLELSDRYDIWQALQQQGCQCACQISKRYDNLKYQSRDFETLRDLTERRLFGYWDGAQTLWFSRRGCEYICQKSPFPNELLMHNHLPNRKGICLWKVLQVSHWPITRHAVHRSQTSISSHQPEGQKHRRSKVSVQVAYDNMSTVAHKTWLISNDWMTIMLHGYALL